MTSAQLNRRTALFGLIPGILLFVVGCGDDWAERTSDGRFLVRIEAQPDPIPLNGLFSLRVHVSEVSSGNPAPGLRLAVDAVMPAHGHGMNTVPRVKEAPSAGSFLVEGMLFHMAGAWEITLTLTDRDSASFVTFRVRVS